MDKLNIGFIGGCVSNQKGIDRSDLYYSVLLRKIKNSGLEKDVSISLGSYTSFDELNKKTTEFVLEKKPTQIFLFVRPFPLILLHKPIIKYDKKENTVGYLLHPSLFNHKLEWPKGLISTTENPNYIFVPKPKFAFRDLNLLVGIMLGLHKWSMKYLAFEIGAIHRICKKHGIGLTLLSPPKNPESIMGNIVCTWTTQSLKKFGKLHSIEIIDLNCLSEKIIGTDGLHLNETGHSEIADLIFSQLLQEFQR